MTCRLMGRAWGRGFLGGMVLLCALGGMARADSQGADDLARQAMGECEQGRRSAVRDDRETHFARGEEIAKQAVAASDTSSRAHFALFCNMGEMMRIDGESISSVFQFHRLMAELNRALELDPGYTDAMAAKGALLVRLPRLLGGDVQQGEAMLREVIAKDPNAFTSRLALAKTCEARGDRDEAVAFATRALQIARDQGRADKVAEAQATMAELRADR